MTLTVGMVTIDSADPAPLAAWWAAALGAPISQENEGWFYVIDATPLLAIQKVGDPTPGKNRIHLDLNAPDLDAARMSCWPPAPPWSPSAATRPSAGSPSLTPKATSSASPSTDPPAG